MEVYRVDKGPVRVSKIKQRYIRVVNNNFILFSGFLLFLFYFTLLLGLGFSMMSHVTVTWSHITRKNVEGSRIIIYNMHIF